MELTTLLILTLPNSLYHRPVGLFPFFYATTTASVVTPVHFSYVCQPDWLRSRLSPTSPEIEKVQKDEGKEEEKFIDVVINKNMKLGQKVLIPVKQFPKVSAMVFPPPEKTWSAQTVGEF